MYAHSKLFSYSLNGISHPMSCGSYIYLCVLPPGFCCWCNSPATWKCDDCSLDANTDTRMCSSCSDRRHKNTKYKSHKPAPLPKRADMELDLLSVICIETSHYVCFTRSEDKWLFFDSMANRVGKSVTDSGVELCGIQVVYNEVIRIHCTL